MRRSHHDLRFDYLLISHFLLNLQNMSSVTTNDSDPCQTTLVGTFQSMRFDVVGNLGAQLRDPLDEFFFDDVAVDDCGKGKDVDVDLS